MSTSEIEREQDRINVFYQRVDELREHASRRLATVLKEDTGAETPQSLVEREAAYNRYAERVAKFDAAENGLCFGRLDLRNGERHYIGRIGLPGDSPEGDPMLIDWRAPAARPFYVATAADPQGVRRRRHITTRHRRVTGLDDELLDLPTGPDGDGQGTDGELIGEAALMAAVNAGRTGRMRDIVATLQAEQDDIIRSGQHGVLVVQGGPGTGKTAVALHRAAYLLYTHPRLAERGVLVIGPTTTFLSYIGEVLPGLGETNVLLSTVAGLFPGVTADRAEPAEVAEIKGRAELADVIAAAVRDRQGADIGPIDIEYEGHTLRLRPEDYVPAADRVRERRLTHNAGRPYFVSAMLDLLTDRVAELFETVVLDEDGNPLDGGAADGSLGAADLRAMEDAGVIMGFDDPAEDEGRPLLDEGDRAALRAELAADPGVRAALHKLWPALTPQQLLTDLYADPARLATAAPGLTDAERALLLREPGGGWSPADVPLLDEAAELLGTDDRAARAAAAAERARQREFAQGVLEIASSAMQEGEADEMLGAADLIDASRLADRHAGGPHLTLAERAATDRTWAFGHVIVDEAQELSRMAWRTVMRRCPTKSMTIVGDVAQTGDAAGTSSWAEVLSPYVGDRWRLARLTVNYRTPAEVMSVAGTLLPAIAPELEPPRSVRESGLPPWRTVAEPAALPGVLAELTAAEESRLGEGRLAVIVPQARLAELGEVIAARLPGVSYGPEPDLESRVVVLGVRQAKGLEFDTVLIGDPAGILTGSPRGANDLYVALTRTTRRLGIVHTDPCPAELAQIAETTPLTR